MVCANYASDSHRTGNSSCQNCRTLCAQSRHRQERGARVRTECNMCGATGHSARECKTRCNACGSSMHRTASSFECPRAQVQEVQRRSSRWVQKGTEGTTAPRRRTPICTLCEVTGHDEERCPTRPGPACGCRTHRLPTPLEFPASAHTLENHAPFRTRRCVH